MGKLHFYALWSLHDAPRRFMRKPNRRCFQVHVPLPLPEQLLVFGLGRWDSSEAVSVEVCVGAHGQAQNIGTLSNQTRCLTWEGEWSPDMSAAVKEKKGVYKIVLTESGEQEKDGLFSSTPLVQRKWSFPEGQNQTDLSSTFLQSTMNDTMTRSCSLLSDSVCFREIQVDQINSSGFNVANRPAAWTTEEPPRRSVLCKRGPLALSSEDMEDPGEASSPKTKILRKNQEEMNAQMKPEPRGVCPSERWSHSMSLTDANTAVLLGGETSDQNQCTDSMWKLQLDSDSWFPMSASVSGPVPLFARGHSATFDPDSKAVFVYGGLRGGLSYNELYILDTLTWKWTLVNAKGKIPTLAYHSAVFYKKDLFVFGGVKPSNSSGEKNCSNALYIFNPEYGLWYQPIVEGDKPLPRYGHSATLLSHQLVIFGGKKTSTYLNDLHILDLGMMEYSAVKSENMPPLPRGFHAALPVSNNKILVSGGCSAIGTLQDVHVFDINTRTWSSVSCPLLSSKPRAGHSIIEAGFTSTSPPDQNEDNKNPINTLCNLLVFGGSDCAGNFYNDTIRCTVELKMVEKSYKKCIV